MALRFEIVVNSNGEPQLKKLGDGVSNTGKKFNTLSGQVKSAMGALAGLYTLKKGVDFFAGMINGVGELGHELDKLQTKTGASAEEISGLRYAFKMADVDMDAMSMAFKGLANSIDGAASGNKKLAKIFEDARVPIKNQDGSLRSVTDVLKDLSVAFNNTENETRKSAIATDLFGRAGQNILLVMPELVKNLQAAKDTGSIWSQEDIDKATKYADSMKELGESWKNLQRDVVTPVLPVISSAIKDLSDEIGKSESKLKLLMDFMAKAGQYATNPLFAGYSARAYINKKMAEAGAKTGPAVEPLPGIGAVIGTGTVLAPGADARPGLGAPAPPEPKKPSGGGDPFSTFWSKEIVALDEEYGKQIRARADFYDKLFQEDQAAGEKNQKEIEDRQKAEIDRLTEEYAEKKQMALDKLQFDIWIASEEERIRNQRIMDSFSAVAILAGINKNASLENFRVFQAAAVAEAIVAAQLAITKAWGSAIFPANLPAVAIVTASALANVAAITSAKPPSFQTNEGEVKTVPGSRNQGILALVHGGEKIGRDQGKRSGNVYIQIAGNIIGQEKYVRDVIIPLINKEISRK